MGTRADFYVGRGVSAEWLGSVAWDGYPSGFERKGASGLFAPATEADWRAKVSAMIAAREDGTTPDKGWPWPWEDSGTTDYAYCFADGKVEGYVFACGPFEPARHDAMTDDEWDAIRRAPEAVFPDMKSRQRVTFGERSGVIVVTAASLKGEGGR